MDDKKDPLIKQKFEEKSTVKIQILKVLETKLKIIKLKSNKGITRNVFNGKSN